MYHVMEQISPIVELIVTRTFVMTLQLFHSQMLRHVESSLAFLSETSTLGPRSHLLTLVP